MAGLPCEVCQGEMINLGNGEPGTDGDALTTYRRFKVCVNASCERCGEVVETMEVALPRPEKPRTVSPTTVKRLRKYLPCDNSQPSLFETLWPGEGEQAR